MNRTLKVVAVLLCLGASVAYAQSPCTLQTFTGTYAFYEKGASAILDPNSQPYQYHWAGAIAPFITVGEITVGSDGVGHGYFWIRTGSLNGGLEPIPFDTETIEMNEDCTGRFSAHFSLAGQPETIVERFILFDNGRQYRAIPVEGGMPTLTWLHEGHRISKPGEPPNTCGQQTAHGRYLWTVENLVRFDTPYPIFSDALLMRLDISMTGEFNGTLYEKLGPTGNIVLPVWGTITVNPDCSFVSTLNIVFQNLGITATAPVRGVFYDEGKKAFGLNMNAGPIGTLFSFGEAVRIGQ